MAGKGTLTRAANRRIFALLFCGFLAYGAVLTLFGATVPKVISDFSWSYTTTGLVLAAVSVGFFVSTFASGLLIEGTHPKAIYLAALCVSAAGVSLFARWPQPIANLAIMFAIGLAQGVIEVVTNYETLRLERPGQSRLMNLLHAGFSVGAIAGPLAVGALMEGGISWRIAFPGCGALFLLLAGAGAFIRFPAPERGRHSGAGSGLALLKQPVLLLLCLAIVLYVGSELGATNWVSEYFVRSLGTSASIGAIAVSVLWLGMAAGRVVLSAVLGKARQEIMLLSLSLVCTASLLAFLGARTPVAAFAAVFVLGLGYSGIYPIVMALAGSIFRSTAAVGMVSTSAGLGSFTFPFLLATIAQAAGLRPGFLLLAGLPLLISVTALLLGPLLRRQKPSATPRP
jgi:fucose permease